MGQYTQTLLKTLDSNICIVGMGFVGLPLAMEFWRAGYSVSGIDVDDAKVGKLNRGESYLADVSNAEAVLIASSERFSCSTRYDALNQAQAIIICVPTPLNQHHEPDLSFVLDAARQVSGHLQTGQVVVLESSTFPGTTDEYVVPILEQSGLKAGIDFFVAYSPERINPGETITLSTIPKVVGGFNSESLRRTVAIYEKVFKKVIPVSSTKVAELTKLLENTQRFVNISMMNELAISCEKWNLNLWEAIDAAATKPYGFTPYHPGPGIGGHCIPIDPLYLQWFAKQRGQALEFIAVAEAVNRSMPKYVANRIQALLSNPSGQVLLVGLTYKKDVNDARESSSISILEELLRRGCKVKYHDPFVPKINIRGTEVKSVELSQATLSDSDVVAILTDHSNLDYKLILEHAGSILDARNIYRGEDDSKITVL